METLDTPDYVSRRTAARLLGLTPEALKKRIQRGRLHELPGKGIPLAELPVELQKLYLSEQSHSEQLVLSQPAQKSINGLALPSLLFPSLAVERQLAGLTPGQQRLACERFRIIEPMLNGEWKKSSGQRLLDGRPIQTKTEFVKWLCAQQHLPVSTFWLWYKRFRELGVAGLVRQPRKDKGVPRLLSAHDRIDLGKLYTVEGSAKGAWREFCRQKRPISYDIVKAFVRTLPQLVRVRALQGAKAFNDTQAGYITRDWDKLAPNDLWVFDHSQFDFFMNAWGKAVRPWLTAALDMKSRHIVGWCISLQPDSLTIASALRMALVECGIPQAVYLDNGKDFRTRYLGGKETRFGAPDFPDEGRGILNHLGVRIIYCTPYNPQAKPIERFFGTLHRQFDTGFNSYCGGRTSRRPETCQPLLAEHRDAVKAGVPDESPLPKLEETALGFRLWLAEYDAQAHSGLRGRAPGDLYQASDRKLAAGQADLLLLKREQRVVSRGAVEIFGRRYEAEGAALFLHNDHRAEVAYDPHGRLLADLGEVLVFCCGQVIHCRHLGEPESHEELRQRLRGRRQLKKLVEGYIAEVHRRATVVSAGERRQAAIAAALPAGVDPRAPARAQLLRAPAPEAEEIALAGLGETDEEVALPDYNAAGDAILRGKKR